MSKKSRVLFIALLVIIGIINSLVLRVVEFVVTDGTEWIWNSLLGSDTTRWAVLPIAVAGSILLSIGFHAAREPRVVAPKVDLLTDESPNTGSAVEVTPADIGKQLGLGMGSLLAGASLGPEATLMEFSKRIGIWSALKYRFGTHAEILTTASIGALLVAFLGSLLPALIPILLLWRKKQVSVARVLEIMIASLASYATLWVIDHQSMGFGDIPASPHFGWTDVVIAMGVGVAAAGLGWILKHTVLGLGVITGWMTKHMHWLAAAAFFGVGLGLLYLLGGQSVQFSGSIGSPLLVSQATELGIWGLLGLLTVKLVATAWSMAAGYRGGLVFPSIYLGVASGLIVATVFGVSAQGAMIGAISGIIAAMVGPAVGIIFVASILPWQAIPLAVFGIAGAAAGIRLIALVSAKWRPPA